MGKKKINSDIQTWSVFGVRSVGIEVHKFEQDGKEYYQGGLTYFLDDNAEVPEDVEKQKVITIMTDIITNDYEETIFAIADNNFKLYTNIGAVAFVLNTDGDILHEIELDSWYPEYKKGVIEDAVSSRVGSNKNQSNVTFH
jgi:hypothetical protein